ncbi:MAG: DUF3299 domain-containing protein [Polaromonas sp.]|nr:MAG: DUF3299 domain-containing protein [Polaromonas sp.]
MAGAVIVIGGLLATAHAGAQVLSSPLGILSPPAASGSAKAAAPAVPAPLLELPSGQGPGVHGANSPFPPLVARDDVLPWSVLTAVKAKKVKTRFLPVFTPAQLALNQKTQRIQGYMMPLDPGEKQVHFLLSSVPLTCSFCTPGGPESMVEVRSKTPVKYSMEPVVVEGLFSVLEDDAFGLFYRMNDARSVK